MPDHATPDLPSRDFAETPRFYAGLGFVEGSRDDGWMILSRGGITLEFFPFPFPYHDPANSSFSCCLRLTDLDASTRGVSLRDCPRPAADGRVSTSRGARPGADGSAP